MVTNLTNYGKQIRFMLSTDDPGSVEWQNGDLVFLMDQDKLVVYDAANFDFREISMGGGGDEPDYGIVDATYVTDTWQGSVSSNVFTLTYPVNTSKYFLFRRPIVLQPEDVLKVESKKVSGIGSFTDLKISTIPQGAINVEQNFLPSATVHASEYTNANTFPLTVVGMGYCTRSSGSGYNNLILQVRVSLNDVVLFSSIT